MQITPIKTYCNKNFAFSGKKYKQPAISQETDNRTQTNKCRNSLKSIISNYTKTSDRANEVSKDIKINPDNIIQDLQRTYEHVNKFYRKVDKNPPKGTILRKIITRGNNKTIEEYANDGSLLIKVLFVNGELRSIQERPKKLPDGNWQIAKEIRYVNGLPVWYSEGCKSYCDGSWERAKEIFFENGQVSLYTEGYQQFSNGTKKIAKEIEFVNNKPVFCKLNFQTLANNTEKTEKEIFFKDGKICSYAEDCKRYPSGNKTVAREIKYENKTPISYAQSLLFCEYGCKIMKKIIFENQKVTQQYDYITECPDGTIKT